jgi:thiamine-phosphate pyrophosphorylase
MNHRKPDLLRGLMAITPDGLATDTLVEKVRHALAGGAALVQYRNKLADEALRLEQATALRALCHTFGRPLIINDDLALAQVVGAAGVHLGRDDGDWAVARAVLGPQGILGVSCYDEPARAQAAAQAGADYLAFGAVYPSPTKPAARRAPLALFESGLSLGRPLAAIGGLTLENAPAVIRAGAGMLAVISDLFDAPDIRARAAAYARLFLTLESPLS